MKEGFSLLDDLKVHVKVPGTKSSGGGEESTFDRIFSSEPRTTRRGRKSPAVQGKWSKADLRAFLSPELEPKREVRDTSRELVSPKRYSLESPTRRYLRHTGARGEIQSHARTPRDAGAVSKVSKKAMFVDEPVSFEGTPLARGSSYEAFQRGEMDEATFLDLRSKELREEQAKKVNAALVKHMQEEEEARRLRDLHREKRKKREVEIMKQNQNMAAQKRRAARRGRQSSTKEAFFEAIYAGQPTLAEMHEKKAKYAKDLATQRREIAEQVCAGRDSGQVVPVVLFAKAFVRVFLTM